MQFNNIIFITLLGLLSNCNSPSSDKVLNNKNDSTRGKDSSVSHNGIKNSFDSIFFSQNCNTLIRFSSFQGLQGTNARTDSTDYLCIANCYNCKETYELIFKYKADLETIKKIGSEFIFDKFQNGCTNDFVDFDCFAFIYPMREPEPGECADKNGKTIDCDSGIDFPVIVKIYVRATNHKWIFLRNAKMKNFEELSSLFFQTVYY